MRRVRAVVMAGGQGTRLGPLAIGRPKPMVPVLNQPVLSHILDLLKRNGEEMGVPIYYATETLPLGTAGSVKNAQQYLDDTFIVISGDSSTDFDLREIVDSHTQNRALATVTLDPVPDPLEYGVSITDTDGRITHFLEKPSWGEGAVLHSDVQVWPEKDVEAGATVKSSIIWEAMGRRVFFGRFGITGLVNVDLTPEFAVKPNGRYPVPGKRRAPCSAVSANTIGRREANK